jgi:hypothetical protein
MKFEMENVYARNYVLIAIVERMKAEWAAREGAGAGTTASEGWDNTLLRTTPFQ